MATSVRSPSTSFRAPKRSSRAPAVSSQPPQVRRKVRDPNPVASQSVVPVAPANPAPAIGAGAFIPVLPHPRSAKKLKQHIEEHKAAIELRLQNIHDEDADHEEKHAAVIVATDVSPAVFANLDISYFKLCLHPDGTVEVYEVEGPAHTAGVAEISTAVGAYAVRFRPFPPPAPAITVVGNRLFAVGGGHYQGDGGFRCEGRPPLAGQSFPSVMFELGVSQSGPELVQKAALWLGPHTDVRIVVVIKYWPPPAPAVNGRMIAAVYRRPAPAAVGPLQAQYGISFGPINATAQHWNYLNIPAAPPIAPRAGYVPPPAYVGGLHRSGAGAGGVPCNQPMMPQYLLTIDENECLDGFGAIPAVPAGFPAAHPALPAVPAHHPFSFFVDLFRIRRMLLDPDL